MKLIASAATKELLIDVLSKRYFFSPVTLRQHTDGSYDVYNRNGQIVGISVCHKGRWRAEIRL